MPFKLFTLKICAVFGGVALGLAGSMLSLQAQGISSGKATSLAAPIADIKAGKNKKAIKKLSGSISAGVLKGGDVARALYYRGMAYHAIGKHGQAIADLTNATFLNGLSSAERKGALETRGKAYRAVGLASRGNADTKRAASTKVTSPVAPKIVKKTRLPKAKAPVKPAKPRVRTIAQAPVPKTPDPVREPAPTSTGGFFSNLFSGGSGGSKKPVTAESLAEDTQEISPRRVRRPVARPVQSRPVVAEAPRSVAKASPTVIAKVPPARPRVSAAPAAWSTNVNRSAPQAEKPSSSNSGGVAGFFSGLFGGGQTPSPNKSAQAPTRTAAVSKPAPQLSAAPAATSRPARTRVASLPKRPVRKVKARPIKTSVKRAAPTPVSEPLIGGKPQTAGIRARSKSATIQVASLRSQGDALRVVGKLNKALPDLTASRRPTIDETLIGNMGTFYRVTLGPFASGRAGQSACKQVRATGMDCFLLTN